MPWAHALRGVIPHTDAEREYAYDRMSKIGELDKAWDEATEGMDCRRYEEGLEEGFYVRRVKNEGEF